MTDDGMSAARRQWARRPGPRTLVVLLLSRIHNAAEAGGLTPDEAEKFADLLGDLCDEIGLRHSVGSGEGS